MRFKGSIVITDPCYLIKDKDKDCYDLPEGFTDYICRSTIYGDWSCMTYKGTPDTDLPAQWDDIFFKFFNDYNFTGKTEEEKKELYKTFSDIKKKWVEDNCYGEF